MLVKLVRDRSDKNRMVAFVDNCICFFPRNSSAPGSEGTEVEVMITGVQFRRLDENIPDIYDFNKPKAFFIRTIEDDDILIRHRGFEQLPHECCGRTGTLALAMYEEKKLILSPNCIKVIVADNRYPQYVDRVDPIPANVYIKYSAKDRHKLKPIIKIEGITTYEDCQYWHNRVKRREEFTQSQTEEI